MRRSPLALTIPLAVAVAGCGGSGATPTAQPPPPPPPVRVPQPPAPVPFAAGPASTVPVPGFATPPHRFLATEATDLDADGVPDLGWALASTVGGKESVLLHARPGVGDGGFTGNYGGSGYEDFGTPRLAAGQVLGVGAEGLAFARPASATGMHLGTLGYRIVGTSRTNVGGSVYASGVVVDLAVADWDGDGIDDLAALDAAGARVVAAISRGETGLDAPVATPLPAGSGAAPTAVCAAEFGAGTGADLFVGLGTDGYVLLGSTGTASFTAGAPEPLGQDRSFTALVAGDFDTDGNMDVAGIVEQAGEPQRIGALLGRGDGTFEPLVPTDLDPALAGATLEHLHAGDLNGDGRTDLALVAPLLRRAVVLLSDAAGGFVPSEDADLEVAGDTLSLHDLDGDGDLDLVVGDSGSLAVHALLNDGP